MKTKQLTLKKIRTDGGTQPRESLNEGVVAEYAEAMEAGTEFPPIVVYHDGSDYWLADGFHRYHGARKALMAGIACEVHSGTRRDAVLHSVGANDAHGLRRSNADKRKAILTLLEDEEWGQWSDNKIAEMCRVSSPTVAKYRAHLQKFIDEPAVRKVERGGKTYTQDTTNIGAAKADAGSPATDASAGKPDITTATRNNPTAQKPDLDTADEAFGDTNLVELLEEMRVDNENLQEQVNALSADDQAAETLKWRRMYEHAMRRQNEIMEEAKGYDRDRRRTGSQVKECCKILQLDDPRKLVSVVRKLAARVEAA